MFFRILKKDLKRKKTMNVILLLFVIMCSMFAAASVNNIVAVTGGVEHYLEISEVPDFYLEIPANSELEDKIKEEPSVSYIGTEHDLCLISSKSFRYRGKKMTNFVNPPYAISDEEMFTKFFDSDNNVIDGVEKGCFYVTASFVKDLNAQKGDMFEVEQDGVKLPLKFMGVMKNATIAHQETAAPYLLLNSGDHKYLSENLETASIFSNIKLYADTTDIQAVRDLAAGYEDAWLITRDDNKGDFTFDMIAAYVMLAISVVLMITAFIVLRFTIGFTISEEFREIGVMKAVGINNSSIRSLYITKYFAISIVGAAIGYVASLPLGKMMVKAVSKNMVLESGSDNLIGLISSAAVVALIMTFCYTCTRRVNKLSPIDAVRNGQTGERFRKKSVLHLGRTKLPSTCFMSLNDVLSAPRQFSIITVIFTLCILMMTLMSTMALTLKSEKIAWLFNIPTVDASILEFSEFSGVLTDFNNYKTIIADTEKMLEEKGIPGKCSVGFGFRYEVTHGGKTANEWCFVTKGLKNDLLKADEGYLPEKKNEVALTGYALDDLGAEIGDKIKITMGDKTDEYIITGKFSTYMGSGHSIQMHPDVDLVPNQSFTCTGINIKFDGSPDKETVEKNIKIIKDEIDSEKVYNTQDMIKSCTQMSDTLNTVKKMMMILTAIVTALIVILMERSFISKEKSEIALMKAVGINNRSIIFQHIQRFVIVALIAAAIASATVLPLSNYMMTMVSRMIGDVSGIKCDFNAAEIFAVCPAIVFVITILGAWFTALYMKTVKASDTASIE